jgi:hypothetical protein
VTGSGVFILVRATGLEPALMRLVGASLYQLGYAPFKVESGPKNMPKKIQRLTAKVPFKEGTTTRTVKFVRQWGGNDKIVWVDIARLDASWRLDKGYYLAPGKPNTFAYWIDRFKNRRIPMPHIALDPTGIVTFTDGRNRFAWFRDHGVKAIPITVATKSEEKIVKRRFGSRQRMVRIVPSSLKSDA